MKPVYLAYFDESGNTGLDLKNAQQPIFALGALLVPASDWASIETELQFEKDRFFADLDEPIEIHTHKLVSGSKPFRKYGNAHCMDFLKAWMRIASSYQLRFFYRSIEKRRFDRWLDDHYGGGVKMDPHAMAFPLVSLVVNRYLRELDDAPLGMFISDEHAGLSSDLEKSLRLLRGGSGNLKLDQVIEKCFFIDSRKSLLLQLSDMCIYCARKMAERNYGHPIRSEHEICIEAVRPLITTGDESLLEVIEWMDQQIKKRPGTESGVD